MNLYIVHIVYGTPDIGRRERKIAVLAEDSDAAHAIAEDALTDLINQYVFIESTAMPAGKWAAFPEETP